MNDQRITARETQRVIKYRAWDGEQMLFPEAGDIIIHIDDGGLVVYQLIENDPDDEDAISDYSTKQINAEVMQFTGLLDKHGKEIYDKDILSLWRQADPNDYEMKAEVFWDNEQFGWFLKCHHPSGQISIESIAEVAGEPEFIERIGNIYTTPELVDPKMIENGNS